MKDFDTINKEALKKKLEYKEYAFERQEELFGLSFDELEPILKDMKTQADSLYQQKQFVEAIETYMKGKTK